MKQFVILLVVFVFILNGCEDEISENIPPVENRLEANAGDDLQTQPNGQLVLDGSKSKDGNEKPFQFLWSIKTKPANSQPVLTGANLAAPTFTTDLAGFYVVELKIFDARFSDTDDLLITVAEQTPPPVQETGILNADISQDLQLVSRFDDPAKPDYLVTEDIHVTAQLLIGPSVTIAFEAGKGMYIDSQANIQAIAALENEAIFTGKEKTPGYWKGLVINSAHPLNKLSHVIVEYGGSAPAEGHEYEANLTVSSTAGLSVESLTIRHGGGYGILAEPGARWQDVLFANKIRNNRKPARVAASHLANLGGYVYENTVNRIEVEGNTVYGVEEIYWSRAVDNRTPAQTVPYFVTGEIVVTGGLHIFEGAEFLFDAGAALTVTPSGYLRALGAGDKVIKFHGAHSAEGGYWKGIAIKSDHVKNELKFVEVYDAGSDDLSGFDKKAAIALDGENHARLKLTNSKIGKSGGYGLLVENHSQLEVFAFNQFGYNASSAVLMPANEVRKLNNVTQTLTFEGNGHNGVEIFGSVLLLPNEEESVWSGLVFGASYLVSGNLSIQSGLKILPGAAFRFAEGKGIRVVNNGYLNASGTNARKITFTGLSETKGSWYGIQFLSNSNQNVLDHTEILYAGKGEHYGIAQAASVALGGGLTSRLSVTNSKIAYSGGYGIAIDVNLTTINGDYETANRFEDLAKGVVYTTEPLPGL
jgi:hypothetical protein